MGSLSETWFAEGYIDFEQKKYTLLAYLQEINRFFHQNMLYPQLADVIFHFNNLRAFKENKTLLQQQFPKQLTAVNLEKLQLLYEQISEDDELMEELENILRFALHSLDDTIRDGTQIYDFVEEQLSISPVGLLPLDTREGYLLLCDGRYRETLVYTYRLSIFERHDEKYRGIHTHFLDAYAKNVSNTSEQIKLMLIRQFRQLPNPAVYRIETDLVFPVNETLLPVAKRTLVKYLSQNVA
ncbi:hypothetical protein GA0116948_11751 [Chitinophaga costaii]|uniref:Uncharacterized protein n=1 Tax=Chitinophaga costaii TaxID=1335309 RepID=A0A1C4FVQ5_9BACT|nr:hypothetical protein [Chitinophaga costaii]PUZ27318.1 hypothetical protein DCM91_08475 [Chitinophaga costaii]SCC59753.1 hypothetical protein GA0116948_11751 [Chitinophaga costaii]